MTGFRQPRSPSSAETADAGEHGATPIGGCPIAHDPAGGWAARGHPEVMQIVTDHETFSNRVSQRLSVPNGMDPPEHTRYRHLIERFFTPERMAAFEPRCRAIAARLADAVAGDLPVDVMARFASPFAAEVQCAFLGWPLELGDWLQDWMAHNQEATRQQARERLAELAQELAAMIDTQLAMRRRDDVAADADITAELLHARVCDEPLKTVEIVSILRNWTAGEVGTISAAVGIVARFLAEHPALQDQLRAEPQLLPEAIDEILRLDGPLPSNRRRATCPVDLAGVHIESDDRLSIIWPAANRDPRVFDEPDQFRWDRNPDDNLLYGAGIHVCPGAPLARLELRVALEELLRATSAIELVPDHPAEPVAWPGAGFELLPLHLRPAPETGIRDTA